MARNKLHRRALQVPELEALASKLIGDDRGPNVYFVSRQPEGVVLITRDYELAKTYWANLPRAIETSLEDRQYGVIASNEPTTDEPGSPLIVRADFSYNGGRR